MPRRLRRVATLQTVPLPTKGSSTVQGTVGSCAVAGGLPAELLTRTRSMGYIAGGVAYRWLPLTAPKRATHCSTPWCVSTRYETSTVRAHGAPHFAQAPSALVPARMHGSTSRSGNVAKWAALTACVGNGPDVAEIGAGRNDDTLRPHPLQALILPGTFIRR